MCLAVRGTCYNDYMIFTNFVNILVDKVYRNIIIRMNKLLLTVLIVLLHFVMGAQEGIHHFIRKPNGM